MSSNFIPGCVFIIYLLIALPCFILTQKCHHQPLQITQNNRIHVDRPITQSRILSPDKRMKFHIDYHSSVMERPQAREIQSVVAEVVDRVSRTLSVKQEPGNLLFETNCEKPRETVTLNGQEYCTVDACYYSICGEITAPKTLSEPCFDCNNRGENCTKTGGPPADREPVHYTLFVASLTASCKQNYIAYAYACRIDDTTDRPVAGVINICPIGFELGRERLLDTVQHEIFHALGFSSSMYGLYRDARGNPLTPREANGLPALNPKTFVFVWSDRVIRNFTLDWENINGTTERSIQAFVTPNVLREARAHFGCPSLMGVELEDGGGYATAMSHFEKRILATESMNGMLTPARVFSRMTLALMEDTGWYIPDYEMADKLNWGKDLGCDFVQKSCKNWIDTRINGGLSPAPWCTNDHEAGCHAEGTDVAFCKFRKYDSPVPDIFQVFTAIDGIEPAELSNVGGNLLTDYCPFFEVDRYFWPNQSTTALLCNNTEIIDDCRKSNCTNGGVCRDVINSYYCNCPAGYAGALCDHVNVECTMNSNCQVNEVCSANRCLCGRDRIRNANDECIGVTDVKEYTIRITLTEVNGVPAVYHRSLMRASGDSFRHGIEYEVRHIIRSNPTLHDALVNVVTRSISSGNIVVDLALIFQKNSFHNSSTITMASVVAATAMQDNVLRRSGTAYTVMANATVVQDANECEDGAGNDCSPYAQCMNTGGSYECTCQPGTTDTGPSWVLPGRECTDVNECSTTWDTDCSIDADCVNIVGSYTCRCRDGYDDDSPDANRPGRVCFKQAIPAIPTLPGPSALPGLQPGVIISLSVGLGVVLLLAVLLYMIIWNTVERRKRSLPYKDPYNSRSPNHLPRHHTHTFVKSVKTVDREVGSNPYPKRDKPRQHRNHDEHRLHRNHDEPRPHRNHDQLRQHRNHDEPRLHCNHDEPRPHRNHDEPRLHCNHDEPRPHRNHDDLRPHRNHDEPRQHRNHDEPRLHRDEPRPHRNHDELRPHRNHDEPRLHRNHDEPRPHRNHDEPRPHRNHDEPSPHRKHDEPRQHRNHDEPRPHRNHDEPRPNRQHDEPCPLPGALYGDLNSSWYYGENRSHMDSPFMSTGTDIYEAI